MASLEGLRQEGNDCLPNNLPLDTFCPSIEINEGEPLGDRTCRRRWRLRMTCGFTWHLFRSGSAYSIWAPSVREGV
ncbi:hypothetical protein DXK93_05080 [Achromobacter sp. K91]|nr:hypothetical protein DXK93_05080 [Achromobacter sp. K91]